MQIRCWRLKLNFNNYSHYYNAKWFSCRGFLTFLRDLKFAGFYYTPREGFRLCSILAKRTILIFKRTTSWSYVCNFGWSCIRRNFLWAYYYWCTRWSAENHADGIFSGFLNFAWFLCLFSIIYCYYYFFDKWLFFI